MKQQPSAAQLTALINGYQVSQAIHVAATLNLADHLKDGPRSADDLAPVVGAHARSLYRLMRALAATGLFNEDDQRRFTLTPLGDLLRSDHPASLAGWAAYVGRSYFWEAWGHLIDGVSTGDNAFTALHGEDVWTWRAKQPLENEIFNRSMTSLHAAAIAAVIAAYDFSRFRRIVDVGGGHGALLAAVLRATPGVTGVLFDQPHVVADAPALLRASGVDDRCEVVSGDMFAVVPPGDDAYLIKSVLHDWDDARCIDILRVIRAAMTPSSRLLVIELVVAPPNEGERAKFSDLNMFVMPGGQERTREEFAALFAAADLTLAAVTPTSGPTAVIEASPV